MGQPGHVSSGRARLSTRPVPTVGGKGRIAFGLTISGQIVDDYCLPLDISQIAQSIEECAKSCRLQWSGIERQETEPRKFFWLLRARSDRPRDRRSAEHAEKFAPPHLSHPGIGNGWTIALRKGRGWLRGISRYVISRCPNRAIGGGPHDARAWSGLPSTAAVMSPPRMAELCHFRTHPSQQKRRARLHGHSITSSARASRVGGRSMPSTLAVLRLTINSNLVVCWIGRSAGFSPLRIRPV